VGWYFYKTARWPNKPPFPRVLCPMRPIQFSLRAPYSPLRPSFSAVCAYHCSIWLRPHRPLHKPCCLSPLFGLACTTNFPARRSISRFLLSSAFCIFSLLSMELLRARGKCSTKPSHEQHARIVFFVAREGQTTLITDHVAQPLCGRRILPPVIDTKKNDGFRSANDACRKIKRLTSASSPKRRA